MADYVPKMTKSDRDALLRLAKERANVAKTTAKRRSAAIRRQKQQHLRDRQKGSADQKHTAANEPVMIKNTKRNRELDATC
jgi:hypothetical protein